MENASKREVVRINGQLKEIVTVLDRKGKVIHKAIKSLPLELKVRDVMQIIVGSSILAIPVGFTEETWHLGQALPMANVLVLAVVSVAFIATFIYYNAYTRHIHTHWDEYLKRVAATYVFSLLVVGGLLTIIQLAPWLSNPTLAFKRLVIVAFPASLSAAIADMIK